MRRAITSQWGLVFVAGLLSAGLLLIAARSTPAQAGVTVFEGARLIVGDGTAPIDNAAFISWAHHLEMEDMVASGMTPAQVIVAATRNAAEFMKLTDAGTVAAGKSADFLVLDANPLDDIKNTRRIADVYLRGTTVDRAAVRSRMMGKSE